MNLDVKELGVTLVVGAYVFYGLELLAWAFLKANLFTKLKDRHFVSSTGSVAISLALSFSIGIFAESASAWILSDAAGGVFDESLRKQIIKQDNTPTPLAIELARNKVFSRAVGSQIDSVEWEWSHGRPARAGNDTIASAAIRPTYYMTKNFVFGHPQYQTEMLSIQTRMSFVGAFAICSVVLAVAALVLFTVGTTQILRRKSSSEVSYLLRPRLSRLILVVPSLLLLAVASLFAYWGESGEYARRALGYYSSAVSERRHDSRAVDTLRFSAQDIPCPSGNTCVLVLSRIDTSSTAGK